MNVNNNNLNAQHVSLFFPVKSFYEYVNGGEQSGCLSVVKKALNVALPIIGLVNLLMLPFIAAYNCFFTSNLQTNPENNSADAVLNPTDLPILFGDVAPFPPARSHAQNA